MVQRVILTAGFLLDSGSEHAMKSVSYQSSVRFAKMTFNSREKISGHHSGQLQGGGLESAIRFIKFPDFLA